MERGELRRQRREERRMQRRQRRHTQECLTDMYVKQDETGCVIRSYEGVRDIRLEIAIRI